MKPRYLKSPGIIYNFDKDYIGMWSHITFIQGMRVLCIGYSEIEIDEYIIKHNPLEIVSLTNWIGHKDANFSKYKLVIGDVTKKTNFEDNEFDAVLTLSVMEHLSDIESAMKELSRIIKPGGYCFNLFGPSWSCAYGHHIYAQHDDDLLNFSLWKMPSHIHLLCSREEIKEFYLENGYSESQCDIVLHWFYETPLINRVMYEDFIRFFNLYFTLIACEVMYNDIDPMILSALRKKFPNYTDFSSYGGKFLLKNNKK